MQKYATDVVKHRENVAHEGIICNGRGIKCCKKGYKKTSRAFAKGLDSINKRYKQTRGDKRVRRHTLSPLDILFQFLNQDILKPYFVAMILQKDVTLCRIAKVRPIPVLAVGHQCIPHGIVPLILQELHSI